MNRYMYWYAICICKCIHTWICIMQMHIHWENRFWADCQGNIRLQCVAVCCSVLQCAASRDFFEQTTRATHCYSVLQCPGQHTVAACCSVLQRVAACCIERIGFLKMPGQHTVAVGCSRTTYHCSILQCIASRELVFNKCHSNTLLQFIWTCCCVLHRKNQFWTDFASQLDGRVLQCIAVCRSAVQCVAVCRSVSQCVAVCCSTLQCTTFTAKPPAAIVFSLYLALYLSLSLSVSVSLALTYAHSLKL